MNADYMVLINGENPVPENYESTVELITVENAFGEQHKVEKKTLEAYLKLKKDLLENDGIEIDLVSVYRTLQFQTDNYDRHMREHGPVFTNKYVARPGHSEHHTGLAFDITVPGTIFKGTEEQKWLHKHCWEYGFVIRYQEDKEKLTGYIAECWHIRYVGLPHSITMRDRNWCLEEYLGVA